MGNRFGRTAIVAAVGLTTYLMAPSAKAFDFSALTDADPAAAVNTNILTAAPAADPTLSPISVGTSGDGKPDLTYNPSSGDIVYNSDGYAQKVIEVLMHSDSGQFRFQNMNQSQGSTQDANTLDVQNGNGITTYDFGNVLPTGFTSAQQVVNFLSAYTAANDPDGYGPSGIFINGGGSTEHFYDVLPLPEPTSLGLIGVAAVGLFSRKRRAAR